jgi:hypothetical protein
MILYAEQRIILLRHGGATFVRFSFETLIGAIHAILALFCALCIHFVSDVKM